MTNYTPLVSIVIPVYNGSNYLKEAIDCVLNQDYSSVEIIVVNDGSTDGGKSGEIARSYGDKIRYFEKENGGVSSALNLGIEMMKGKYFTWLSHDDILGPSYISSQVECINTTGKNAAICRVGVIDDDSKIISEYHNWNIPFFITDKPYISNMIWLYACAILVDKEFFQKGGLFSTKYRTCQDVLFTYNVLHHMDCAFNKVTESYRREHSNNSLKDNTIVDRNETEMIELFDEIIATRSVWFFFTKYGEKLSRMQKLYYMMTVSSCFKYRDQIGQLYKMKRHRNSLLKLAYGFSSRFIYFLRVRNLIVKTFK